jgi:replicative DNA helicase
VSDRHKPPQLVTPPKVAGRVPPHDLDAEAATISAILLSRDALDRVLEMLKPEHFYSEANARIYQAAQQLAIAMTPVDMISVASWLNNREWLGKMGGTAYLAQLADATPAVGHVETHAKVVHEKWRLRQLIATCQRVSAEGYGDVGEAQEFIDASHASIGDIAAGSAKKQAIENAPIIADRVHASIAAEIANMGAPREDKVISGMPDLDRLMGAFKPSLNIIAAWSGVGKTSLAREWALRTIMRPVKKRGVIIFAFEMTRDEMLEAMAYGIAGVDSAKLGALQKLTADEGNELGKAFAWLKTVPWLWILDQETMEGKTPRHIEAVIRRIIREDAPKHGVEVAKAFVDYLQLCNAEGLEKGANREREISSVAYGLQGVSQRQKLPVIALSQLNEDGKKRKDGRPCAEDTRESKAILQAAHKVILLHNPHYLERRRMMQEQGGSYTAPDFEDVELIVDKNRGGRTGIVSARFLPWCTRFEDMPPGGGN